MTVIDLSTTDLQSFLSLLNAEYSLALAPSDIETFTKTLSDQWFSYAADLRYVDREVLTILNFPMPLQQAIIDTFKSAPNNLLSLKQRDAATVSPSPPIVIVEEAKPKANGVTNHQAISGNPFDSDDDDGNVVAPVIVTPSADQLVSKKSWANESDWAVTDDVKQSLASDRTPSVTRTTQPMSPNDIEEGVNSDDSDDVDVSEGKFDEVLSPDEEPTQSSLNSLYKAVDRACEDADKEISLYDSLHHHLQSAIRRTKSPTQSAKLAKALNKLQIAYGFQQEQIQVEVKEPQQDHAVDDNDVDNLADDFDRVTVNAVSEQTTSPSISKVNAATTSLSSPSTSIEQTCAVCNHALPSSPSADVYLLGCRHAVHRKCIESYLTTTISKNDSALIEHISCPVANCSFELSADTIQSLVSPAIFGVYNDLLFAIFIARETITCPNAACKAQISVAPFDPSQLPAVITEVDEDGRLMTREAYRHFCQFRLRCRECNKNFCAECKRSPYHKGFTCATYEEYLAARHCRFCKSNMDKSNTPIVKPGTFMLKDVCTGEECVAKAALCCTKTLACGCPCNGVKDEVKCLACLKHDLKIEEEFCPICYVEALNAAPCVQLTGPCTHTFHYQCVMTKLESRWPNARISFEFKNCPICKQSMNHPALIKTLQPILDLEKEIHDKSMQRLVYEGREKDPSVIEPKGEHYKDPLGLAMKLYLFYMCFKCSKPYFAGGYQCQEAQQAFDPAELICPGCQPHSVEDCAIHGKDWLAYKCRYCCSFANWYCLDGQTPVSLGSGTSVRLESLASTSLPVERPQSVMPNVMSYDAEADEKSGSVTIARCTRFIPQGEKECVQLTFYDGRSLVCTADHKIMTDDGWIEAAQLRLNDTRVLISLDAPLDSSDDDCDNGFSLVLPRLHHHFHMRDTNGGRNAILAFARINGLVHAQARLQSTRISDVTLYHQLDLDQFSQDHYTLTGKQPRHYTEEIGSETSFRIELDSDLVDDIESVWKAQQQFPPILLSKECPPAVIREFFAALFGASSIAPTPASSDDGFNPIILTALDKERDSETHFLAALERVDLPPTSFSTQSQQLTLASASLLSFSQRVGFRYSTRKLAGLTVAAAFYRRQSAYDLSSSIVELDDDGNDLYPHHVSVKRFIHQMRGDAYFNQSSLVSARTVSALILSVSACHSVGRRPVYDLSIPTFHSFIANGVVVSNCWGNTHFCERCHKSGIWQNLTTFRTGKNKKKLWEYENCPSLKAQLDAIGKDTTLTDEQKNDKAEKCMSVRGACILGIPHPPNGIEFGLGCSMCEDKHSSGDKLKIEQDIICNTLAPMRGDLLRQPKVCVYKSDLDTDGLFYYLGTLAGRQQYKNPAAEGYVRVTSSGLMGDSAPLYAAIGRELVRCVTTPVANSWFIFDLTDFAIMLTHYTLRHYNSWDTECLRFWVLEASNDGTSWEAVSKHENDTSLNKKGATHTWQVNSRGKKFRYWRLFQNGRNSNGNHYLPLSGMELYGTVTLSEQGVNRGTTLIPIKEPAPAPSVPTTAGGKMFVYKGDFDQNGIMYYFGTKMGTSKEWTNPADLGFVRVSCSELAANPPSVAVNAVVGRASVRCVTASKPNQWFAIDITQTGKRIRPTHYTLRHYNSWDLEALRCWRFEAHSGRPGTDWVILSLHTNDQALNGKGSSHTWALKCGNNSFVHFRVWQTGKNSNGHDFLALSGFELYGELSDNTLPTTSNVAPNGVAAAYQHPPMQLPLPPPPAVPSKPFSQPPPLPYQHDSALIQNPNVNNNNQRMFIQLDPASPSVAPFLVHLAPQYDFDTNGVFFYLGSSGRRTAWTNPADLGIVSVTSTALAPASDKFPASLPATAAIGRDTVRCVTIAKPDMWFCVDFKDKLFAPTHYTLRHYNSWDTECLRFWRLEATVDGVQWEALRIHVNDKSLNCKGASQTWPLQPIPGRFYRKFRVYQTGVNSNNNLFLALSGWEMYGLLYAPSQLSQQPPPVLPSLPPANQRVVSLPTRPPPLPPQPQYQQPLPMQMAQPMPMQMRPPPPPSPHHMRAASASPSPASPHAQFSMPLPLPPTPNGNLYATQPLQPQPLSPPPPPTYVYQQPPPPALSSPAAVPAPLQRPHSVSAPLNLANFVEGKTFSHQSDFDTNGVLYYLGTRLGTAPWSNPAEAGIIEVTSVPLAVNPPSAPATAIAGRSLVRCVTQPCRESSFTVDLKTFFVCPNAYSLRHYDSWDTECLRDWKLQASNDGVKWTKLLSHKKDESLNGKGSTHTWPLTPPAKAYRMFRILQTGKNSNGHWYCALSGFEIYGQMFTSKHIKQ